MSPAHVLPIGQLWLIEHLGLDCMPPATLSYCGQTARRTIIEDGITIERYGPSYKPDDTVAGHLKFALKNEPLDMGVLSEVFAAMDPREMEEWVRSEPNGAYARRGWFMYEWFTGRKLDLPDAPNLAYADALDPKLNVGAAPVPSQRHRVRDNMLGVPGFCFTVRPTPALEQFRASEVDREAQDLMRDCDPVLLERAVNYLFTKETKSSFEIEREEATGKKAERFVAALRNAAAFDPAKKRDLVALQNVIVDERYKDGDFRDSQNFVSQSIGPGYEKVHFISPRPSELEGMMADWMAMEERMRGAPDPVIAAAAISFSFVFLHPFEDGNGRIHRFLMHHVLSREGFTPPHVLFPVSAAIIRDERGYDAVLEAFSRPLLDRLDWRWTGDGGIEVANDASRFYRYFDATRVSEFLAEKVAETVRHDLKEELQYVAVFDQAYRDVSDIVDMPNRRLLKLLNICLQNHGALSKRKREHFSELTDAEVERIEEAVRRAISEHGPAEPAVEHAGSASTRRP